MNEEEIERVLRAAREKKDAEEDAAHVAEAEEMKKYLPEPLQELLAHGQLLKPSEIRESPIAQLALVLAELEEYKRSNSAAQHILHALIAEHGVVKGDASEIYIPNENMALTDYCREIEIEPLGNGAIIRVTRHDCPPDDTNPN